MCGSGGAADDPYVAKRVRHGGRGAMGRPGGVYGRYFVVDKAATAANEKNRPKGRGGIGRDYTVFEKDEHGRNKLKAGYGYFSNNGKETNAAMGTRGRGATIWQLGKATNGERTVRPGDKRGGSAAETPTQVSAANRQGKRLAGKKDMGQKSGNGGLGKGNQTILTSSHGLGSSAKTNKTLLGG